MATSLSTGGATKRNNRNSLRQAIITAQAKIEQQEALLNDAETAVVEAQDRVRLAQHRVPVVHESVKRARERLESAKDRVDNARNCVESAQERVDQGEARISNLSGFLANPKSDEFRVALVSLHNSEELRTEVRNIVDELKNERDGSAAGWDQSGILDALIVHLNTILRDEDAASCNSSWRLVQRCLESAKEKVESAERELQSAEREAQSAWSELGLSFLRRVLKNEVDYHTAFLALGETNVKSSSKSSHAIGSSHDDDTDLVGKRAKGRGRSAQGGESFFDELKSQLPQINNEERSGDDDDGVTEIDDELKKLVAELATHRNAVKSECGKKKKKKKKKQKKPVREKAEVHPVCNALMLRALFDKLSDVEGETPNVAYVERWPSQDSDVQLMDAISKKRELQKLVKKELLGGKGVLSVIETGKRATDFALVQHDVDVQNDDASSESGNGKAKVDGVVEDEVEDETKDETEDVLGTLPGEKLTGCGKHNALLVGEWKRDFVNDSSGRVAALGGLLRDFHEMLPAHFTKEVRDGFGVTSDGVEWNLYRLRVSFHGEAFVKYDRHCIVLVEDDGDDAAVDAANYNELVSMLRAMADTAMGEPMHKPFIGNACVEEDVGDEVLDEEWDIVRFDRVLANYDCLVVLCFVQKKNDGDDGRTIVVKWRNNAEKRFANEKQAWEGILEAKKSQEVGDNDDALVDLLKSAPISELATLPPQFAAMVRTGVAMCFEYLGERLDRICMCRKEKRTQVFRTLFGDNAPTNAEDIDKLTAGDMEKWNTTFMQQYHSLWRLKLTHNDAYFGNVVVDEDLKRAYLVDFESVLRYGDERPKDFYQYGKFSTKGIEGKENQCDVHQIKQLMKWFWHANSEFARKPTANPNDSPTRLKDPE